MFKCLCLNEGLVFIYALSERVHFAPAWLPAQKSMSQLLPQYAGHFCIYSNSLSLKGLNITQVLQLPHIEKQFTWVKDATFGQMCTDIFLCFIISPYVKVQMNSGVHVFAMNQTGFLFIKASRLDCMSGVCVCVFNIQRCWIKNKKRSKKWKERMRGSVESVIIKYDE